MKGSMRMRDRAREKCKGLVFAFCSLVCLLPGSSLAMQQGEWSLDINGASWHAERRYNDDGTRRKYNQDNPGLGGSYAWRDWLDIKAGFFENSYYEDSVYAGVYLHKDYYAGNWTVAPGLSLLLVSGYDDTPQDAPAIAPIPVLGVTFGHRALKLNLGLVPFGDVEFATLQLQISPQNW